MSRTQTDGVSWLCGYEMLAYVCLCAVGTSQQTRGADTMLVRCWADVVDGGPTLNQHCVNVSCLLGSHRGSEAKTSLHLHANQNVESAASQISLFDSHDRFFAVTCSIGDRRHGDGNVTLHHGDNVTEDMFTWGGGGALVDGCSTSLWCWHRDQRPQPQGVRWWGWYCPLWLALHPTHNNRISHSSSCVFFLVAAHVAMLTYERCRLGYPPSWLWAGAAVSVTWLTVFVCQHHS